jgi:hypothetical protein
MRSRRHVWMGCVVALMVALAPARAQTGAEAVSAGTADALREISQNATVIFSGQVVAVRPGEGVVEIDFSVEDAVRGVSGGVYTLREWAGLWGAGSEPLRLGQRYLMLLHAPGVGGLSSPVGGADGAIPILGTGAQGAVADGRAVDLRWIAMRVGRAVSFGAEPMARAASLPVAVRAETRGAQVDVTLARQGGAGVSGGAPYAAVVGLLRDWEKADAAR